MTLAPYAHMLDVMKRYADHFTLEWRDDISGWDEEIPKPIGGGAFLPSPAHTPPDLYLTDEDVFGDGKKGGPYILISYDEKNMPRDMFQDVVTISMLERAIQDDEPLHDPEGTVWLERRKTRTTQDNDEQRRRAGAIMERAVGLMRRLGFTASDVRSAVDEVLGRE